MAAFSHSMKRGVDTSRATTGKVGPEILYISLVDMPDPFPVVPVQRELPRSLCPMREEETQQNTVQRIPRESPQVEEQKGGNREIYLLD